MGGFGVCACSQASGRHPLRTTSSRHQRCRRKQLSHQSAERHVADLEIESASRKGATFVFISHVFRAGENQQRIPTWLVERAIVIGAPSRRVADLEIESAIHKGAVFKPFAATKQGTITAEQINKGSKRHRTNFRGPSASHGRKRWIRGWSTTSSTARPSWVALCPNLELSTTSWRDHARFAAVFYCRKIEAFVIKGLYTCIREQCNRAWHGHLFSTVRVECG